MQFRKNFSKVISLFVLLATTLRGESHSSRCPHRKLLTDYPDLGLTKMPFVNRSPEVKPQ